MYIVLWYMCIPSHSVFHHLMPTSNGFIHQFDGACIQDSHQDNDNSQFDQMWLKVMIQINLLFMEMQHTCIHVYYRIAGKFGGLAV